MADEIKTVEVRWPKKFGQETRIINATDFDPAIHQLVEESGPDAPAAGHHAVHHAPTTKGK